MWAKGKEIVRSRKEGVVKKWASGGKNGEQMCAGPTARKKRKKAILMHKAARKREEGRRERRGDEVAGRDGIFSGFLTKKDGWWVGGIECGG